MLGLRRGLPMRPMRPLVLTVLAVWPLLPTFTVPQSRPRPVARQAGAAGPAAGLGRAPLTRRWAEAATAAEPAKAKPAKGAGDPTIQTSFSRGVLGSLLLGAALVRQDPRTLTALFTATASLDTLRSAAERGRLDGGTFRVLSLALLAAFSIVCFDGCAEGFRILNDREVHPSRAFLVAAAVGASLPVISGSYKTLKLHGLPAFKLGVQADGGRWLGTALALAYAGTAVHQLVTGAWTLLYTNTAPITGALRCFVVAACAHVCQTAAVAGPKRLSSETYRTLNLALALDSLVTLILTARSSASLVAPAVGLLAAASGWTVGKLYTAE